MNAEPRRVTKTEFWTEWEGQVVNGIFPLRRFLGGSDHSVVFLTEFKAENLPDAAIKFVPADTLRTEDQLVQWGAAATLSHPHLMRIFDVGRCQLGGRGFLFVVTEYAEQTLAQILPKRALSPEEVREMLLPTLDTLAFLHGSHLAHCQLKPSNILVVNDQLKLASDTVRPTGHSTTSIPRTSFYDPPELQDGETSAAGDIWGLGITLIEALTQRAPSWLDERNETASLPASIPAPFEDTVRRCLSRTPANRPSVVELQTQYKPASQARSTSLARPLALTTPHEGTSGRKSAREHLVLAAVVAAILISLTIWAGVRFSREPPNSGQPAAGVSQPDQQPPADPALVTATPAPPTAAPATSTPVTPARVASTPITPAPVTPAQVASTPITPAPVTPAQVASTPVTPAPVTPAQVASTPVTPTPVTPAAIVKSAESNPEPSSPVSSPPDATSLPPADTSLSALHEVIPDVPPAIRAKIRGHINITMRVLVDASGDVVGEFLENSGSSKYFAHLAADAAVEWKFAPIDSGGPRVWLLHFEFNRGGVSVNATAAQ
jgi:serine/threonine protein kinase